MRLAVLLCAVLVAAAAPGRAQPYTGPDGFAICPYANSVIGKCQPLTEQAMRGYSLTAAQSGIVATLQRVAAKPEPGLLDALVNSKQFAPPRQFAAGGEYSDYWFPDPAKLDKIECGIHFRYIKEDLYQMTYAVDGGFIVIWSRVAAETPPK